MIPAVWRLAVGGPARPLAGPTAGDRPGSGRYTPATAGPAVPAVTGCLPYTARQGPWLPLPAAIEPGSGSLPVSVWGLPYRPRSVGILLLVPAGWRDVLYLRRLRNDPATRRQMGHAHVVGLREHLRWYRRMRADRLARVYVAVESVRGKVGAGYFTVMNGTDARLSVAVGRRHRGLGYGSRIVIALSRRAERQGLSPVAQIRPGNEASMRAFGSAGFKDTGRTYGTLTVWRRQ